MNYSVFEKNKFFIRKNSTLPVITYPFNEKLRESYNITENMFENIAITFSMINSETGHYKVANLPANLTINKDIAQYPYNDKYMLTFKFKEHHTNKAGNYEGEFVVDFLGENQCGKLKIPINDRIDIIITDSITNTTVI